MQIIKNVKRIVQNFIMHMKYDVKLRKGASTDLRTVFEGKNLINKNAGIYSSFVGLGTYISGHTQLTKVKIGRFCSIGQNVKNSFGVHPSREFVSAHPAFFSLKKQAGFTFTMKQSFLEHKYIDDCEKFLVEIGNDVWIGNDVKIMDGIKIGDGAIVATGSIITKNVMPYNIVGGIPAKIIRKRFSDEEIKFLLDFQWWEKDFTWIQKNYEMFSSIQKFINYVKQDDPL